MKGNFFICLIMIYCCVWCVVVFIRLFQNYYILFVLTRQDFFFYKEKSYVQKKIFKRKKKKRGLPVVLKHINRIIIDATNIYHTYILYSLTYTLHTQNDISPPKDIFSSLREIRLHKPDTSPLLYSTQREYLLELGKKKNINGLKCFKMST